MKLNRIFLIGAIALGMVACDKNDLPNGDEVAKATMSLKITQDGIQTRAVGTTTTSDLTLQESNIKKLEVFVFNGDTRDGYKSATSATSVTEVKEIAVTTGARSIIVVANSSVDISGVTSKAALKSTVAELLSQNPSTNGILMTSEETASINIAAGVNVYGYATTAATDDTEHSVGAPVLLTRVPARVALVAASTAFEGAYTGWVFKPAQVFLFNARSHSNYFGTDLIPTAATNVYYSGIDLTGPATTPFNGPLKPTGWITSWTQSILQDVVTDLSSITTDKPIYYYAFENNATFPTVITVKGKLETSTGTPITDPAFTDADGFTYYSVIVNGGMNNYTYTGTGTATKDATIKRNTQYNISLVIKRPGTNDPTDGPTESATLDVLVNVVPWIVVNQNVIY